VKKIVAAGLLAAALALPGLASAATVDTITVNDGLYGPANGAIDDSATGSLATFVFGLATAGTPFVLAFTDASGVINDVLFSGVNNNFVYFHDSIEFAGAASGNALIGTTCVASGITSCLVITGGAQDVTGNIPSLVFGGSVEVTIGDLVVPEPASMLVLGAGIAGLGAVRRRRG
jgi:hypothetical protein